MQVTNLPVLGGTGSRFSWRLARLKLPAAGCMTVGAFLAVCLHSGLQKSFLLCMCRGSGFCSACWGGGLCLCGVICYLGLFTPSTLS